MAQYFLGKNNQRLGPFPLEQLLANGLTPDTLVWCSGMPGWQKANEVPEVAALFAPQQQQYQQPQYQQPQYQQPQPQYQQPAYQQPQYQQPQYQQPAYQQPQYGYQQPAYNNAPPRPDNNLVWAILSTILCCLPLGIVAIIKASNVNSLYDRGDYAGAEEAAKSAKTWAMWGAISALIIWVLYILLVVVFGVAAGIGASGY